MKELRVATAFGRTSRLAAAIIAALAAAQTVVQAQENVAAQENVGDEILVTGSRLRTSGIDMPNPVTVVTKDEISVIAPTNLIEGLSELPQFYLSSTTQNPSPFFTSDGAGCLNLRGLNCKRTLQLLGTATACRPERIGQRSSPSHARVNARFTNVSRASTPRTCSIR